MCSFRNALDTFVRSQSCDCGWCALLYGFFFSRSVSCLLSRGTCPNWSLCFPPLPLFSHFFGSPLLRSWSNLFFIYDGIPTLFSATWFLVQPFNPDTKFLSLPCQLFYVILKIARCMLLLRACLFALILEKLSELFSLHFSQWLL